MFEFKPQHNFFIGIDSDGCVFDTMEVKHKECFIPAFIDVYNLQAVSRFAREAFEFVNLYSTSRGTNRFLGLIESLQWLSKRPEVRARGVEIAVPQSLLEWTRQETKLGNPALAEAVQKTGDPELQRALTWSQAVNRAVEQIVHGVPPFPNVREVLSSVHGLADLVVVSATPTDALCREWAEHRIDPFVRSICGQELGSKRDILRVASHYATDRVLMVGDAPGDYRAAEANGSLFFPINPGREEASWKELHEHGIPRFFSGTFAGRYQQQILEEFRQLLPAQPPWRVLS